MEDHWKIKATIRAATKLAGTKLGAYTFKQSLSTSGFGNMLQRSMMEFMGKADQERSLEVARVATIASNLVVRVFSEPRPQAVKRSFQAMMEGFASVSQRDFWRADYGAAPSFYVLNPTQECNMACWGCYDNCRKEGASLSLDLMDWIVSEMKSAFGVHFVVISGGEPFIRVKELGELARRHQDVVFMVYTNGSLITPKVISLLADLGNVSPAISLEGDEAETDKRRGRGHFKKMNAMITLLRASGVIYGFSATMTRKNADYLTSERFVQWCADMGYLFGWVFQYIPIGRNPQLSLMATPEQRMELGKFIRSLRLRGFPLLIADFWNDGNLTDGCIAGGRRYVHISADKHLKPCVFTQVAVKDGDVDLIKEGRSPYSSLPEAILTAPLMVKFRENQDMLRQQGVHRLRPCSVIDHPELFREICQLEDAVALTPHLCPPGILDGEIAEGLDGYSQEFTRIVEAEIAASKLVHVA